MPKKSTTSQFIEKSNLSHGNFYDYSKSKYITTKTPICIICPIHGEFLQMPASHILGSGCSKCAKRHIPSTDEFVEKAKIIHGNEYDYSLVKYVRCKDKVIIKCQKHGEFLQMAKSHLEGAKCLKCGKEKMAMTTDEFISRSEKMHGKIYDYSKVEYIKNHIKVEIVCKIHGPFAQQPRSHILGRGCPICSKWVSLPETKFLDFVGVPNNDRNRQVRIGKFFVDGIVDKTIYEFLGDYWHGNLSIYEKNKINHQCNSTFGELYNKTIQKFDELKHRGYSISYIWEKDWNDFIKNKIHSPKILTH